MFFTSGQNPHGVGDLDVVEHEGRLHLFHLTPPNHHQVNHLVSDDGLHWDTLPPAIRTGEPGAFDDDQIWTMGVRRFGDTWFMLYTALQDNGLTQVTGLATSKDLVHWTKADGLNPVARADQRWYEASRRGNYRVDWRDPHIVEDGGRLHAFVCAREQQGLLNHRGCAGYFTSEDGYTWHVQPPACTPRNAFDYECPSVFKLDGRYYMVAIHGGHDRETYRVAERVEGPYRRLWSDALMPGRSLSHRPCFWRGQQHLFHWTTGQRDWGTRHAVYQILGSPKIVRADSRGLLRVESFDWSGEHAGRPARITATTPGSAGVGRWEWLGESLRGVSEFGTGTWLLAETFRDFDLRADLQLDPTQPAPEFGLLFRADDTGDRGTYASCVPGRFSAELVRQTYNRRNGPESLWRGRSLLQSYPLAPVPDGKYRLRLIAYGPNLEFNVNGQLTLAFLSMPERSGRLGFFLEDGAATFTSLSVAPLKEPTTNWNL